MSVRIQNKNPKAIEKRIAAMRTVAVKVGIQGTEAARVNGKATIADIAAIHEFGLGNVPERSWLRSWHDENLEVARDKLRKGYRKVISGDITPETLATAFGIWAVASIQERIASGLSPALEAETVKRKGSSVPLIDTGLLRSSVTFVLETGEMVGIIP